MFIKLYFSDYVGYINIIKKFFEAICFTEITPINRAVDIANVKSELSKSINVEIHTQKYAKGGNVSI